MRVWGDFLSERMIFLLWVIFVWFVIFVCEIVFFFLMTGFIILADLEFIQILLMIHFTLKSNNILIKNWLLKLS